MNPVLQKIIDDITAKVQPKDQEMYQRTVSAGLHIMFDPSTHQNMQLVQNPETRKHPEQTIAQGVSGLMYMMYIQSKKTLTIEVMSLAGAALMAHAIDFAERSLGLKFSNDMIALTTKLLVEQLFQRLGVGKEQLQQAINEGAAKIQQSGGQTPPQGALSQAGA